MLGLTDGGTASYNNLALQFRYSFRPQDRVVLQLSHEELGDSPVQEVRDDVEVDWLFYEHRFETGFYFKVGRCPIPLGIYNEIRNVGNLIPFYSPPISIYFEDQFTTETVDGVVAGYTFFSEARWTLSADLYGGQWSLFETGSGQVSEADADHAIGIQLWLETPVSGLRLGAGVNRYDVSGGLIRVEESDRWETLILSIDGNFDQWLFRSELYRREVPVAIGGGLSDPKVEADSYYLQVGHRFGEHWVLHAQAERTGRAW